MRNKAKKVTSSVLAFPLWLFVEVALPEWCALVVVVMFAVWTTLVTLIAPVTAARLSRKTLPVPVGAKVELHQDENPLGNTPKVPEGRKIRNELKLVPDVGSDGWIVFVK